MPDVSTDQEPYFPATIEEYILLNRVDGVKWKADQLLSNVTSPVVRNARFEELAHLIALIDKPVARDDYARDIGKKYNLQFSTFKQLIADASEIRKRQKEIKKTVRKNQIIDLKGSANTYPFFVEELAKGGTFKEIKINKVKFVELLSSFGFTRFEVGDNDKYTFVRIQGNIIKTVTRDEIIDFIESFIRKEYDFNGAEIEFVNAEMLINKFYDGMRSYFSTDLFARVRTTDKIIINKDLKDKTFLYYQNGFVEVTNTGWQLKSYDEMDGSVWEHQMLNRNFEELKPTENADDNVLEKYGYFADFCYKLSNENEGRFKSLCTIIGYLIHNFYEYKLKAILFTDSSLSESSEGRTGKTLLSKMIGQVRSYCEINGKDFDTSAITKYQDANLGTQVLHINDVKHKGRYKFDFEDVFNDITEGYIVKKLYMPTFRQYSKMILSSNKTLNIQGASQRDRILEFEVSAFFGEHLSPAEHYEHWFIRDWNEIEFNRFDNFMCLCAQMFHIHGLLEPEDINLGERKLMNHTSVEFLDFMNDIASQLKTTGNPWKDYKGVRVGEIFAKCDITEFAFDKSELHKQFITEYPDFKDWLKQKTFTNWLVQFATLRLDVKKPKQWKSNGVQFIQFVNEG
jgi:hypothetical protein